MSADLFLAWTLTFLGVAGILIGGVILWQPGGCRRALTAFPRSRLPGWILSAIGVVWVTWVVQHAALGRFEFLKPVIPVAGLLLFAALVFLMDELLAPRALGGVLLLVANPILMGVRWADSAWRLVPVLIAYFWVLAGCALMLHPWLWGWMLRRFYSTDASFRTAGWGKLIGGAILLAAGLWHLR